MKGLIIKIDGMKFNYLGMPPILNNLDFRLYEGDRIGLLAPNGSGKTTLFNIIMGLTKPVAGKIEIFGKRRQSEKDFIEVRRRVGMLFQNSDDQLFSPTVLDDVAFGPMNLGKSKEKSVDLARNTLRLLEIETLENMVTYKLSGGEKRLVALATILSMEPKVLLLDEPSAGLDYKTKKKLVDVLNILDLTFVIVSHEFDLLSETTQRILTMRNGRIVSDLNLHLHIHKHAHKMGMHPHKHC